jgi:nucleoside-diphosphate-sugar epimerase
VTNYRGDLTSVPDLLVPFAAGADVLYHCAGEIWNASAMHAVHVAGTAALLGAVRGRVGRWVHLSSVGVYGPDVQGTVTEQSAFHPRGPYEQTKAEAERLVSEQAGGAVCPWTILRPSIVFGIGMPNASLYQLISFVQRGLFFFVGPAGATAPYVPVESVVSALMLCGRHPDAVGKAFNLSDDRTLEEFVATIAAALHRPTPTRRLPAWLLRSLARLAGRIPGSPLTESRVAALTTRVRYSTRRIEGELGYRPEMPVEDALGRLVADWTRQRGKA